MNQLKQAASILGRLGGKKKSPAKTAACRANAKKPRKRVIVVTSEVEL